MPSASDPGQDLVPEPVLKTFTSQVYHVLKKLGSGGFSRVYEITDPTGNHLALKKSHVTKHVPNPMLRHEACALSLLAGHPSIPKVHAYGRSQYFEYLVMDLLDKSLIGFIKERRETNSISKLFAISEQMLAAVEHIHSCNIIHRDIKPENFLFGAGANFDRLYLIDFGVSCYYRNPADLVHRPLVEKQSFAGTVHYASINAHLRFRQSRRDDLESLAYSIAYLFRENLPWDKCTKGTIRHQENSIREMKRRWTGRRIFEGYPEELGQFIDYIRGLEYDEKPDYGRWRRIFGDLSSRAGLVSVPNISDGASSKRDGVPSKKDLQDSPVSRGDYVLIQILPHVTIEGTRFSTSSSQSTWHDPDFLSDKWVFPKHPVLVLSVKSSRIVGAFNLAVAPVIHLPASEGQLDDNDRQHYIRISSTLTGDNNSPEVVPSPEWRLSSTYHFGPPLSFNVQVGFDQRLVQAQYKLEESQINSLTTYLSDSSNVSLSDKAKIINDKLRRIRNHSSFLPVADIFPLRSTDILKFPNSDSSISWSGWSEILQEITQLSRRRSADDGYPWTEDEVVESDSEEGEDFNSDDENFMPKTSWPAPQGVSASEIFQDEGLIFNANIQILETLPVEIDTDIYNKDERIKII